MSNDASCPRSNRREDLWSALDLHGYVVTNEDSLGLPVKSRQNFCGAYFNEWTLRHDEGDWPVDRLRARDVICYEWHDSGLVDLRQHEVITVTDRSGIPGRREHARVEILKDPEAENLVRTFLELVPPHRRRVRGTFGVNLFRTFTNVVTTPHHDNEEFTILYVLDRIGDGAETYLYRPKDVAEDGQPISDAILRQQLNPGDIIIFEDKRFKHGATPLVNPEDGAAHRDALVCTVDYPSTYPEVAS
ncbi:MAG TPA: 2OG-Fe dioxygenase family protein [Streptosporangiaceae bacterium]|nr:2OG-Fe dioxygenase family protein [Streptosporangiaceae bacterium]